jgi:hypothetical protein
MSNWGRLTLPPLLLLLLIDSLEEANLDPYFQTCRVPLAEEERRACGFDDNRWQHQSQFCSEDLSWTHTDRGEEKKKRAPAHAKKLPRKVSRVIRLPNSCLIIALRLHMNPQMAATRCCLFKMNNIKYYCSTVINQNKDEKRLHQV